MSLLITLSKLNDCSGIPIVIFEQVNVGWETTCQTTCQLILQVQSYFHVNFYHGVNSMFLSKNPFFKNIWPHFPKITLVFLTKGLNQ